MTPSVSIIIPLYNAAAFLSRTLDSILAQTLPSWECVIVDDGSSDASPAVAASYVARDQRFRLLRQANAGVAAARNAGFAHCHPHSSFVVFMDNDDLFMPDALEALRAAIAPQDTTVGSHAVADMIDSSDNPLCPAAFASYLRARQKVSQGLLVPCEPDDPTTLDVVVASPIYPPGIVMIKKSELRAAGPFNTRLRGTSDLDMLIRLARFGQFNFLDKIVVKYRRHQNNESNEPRYMWREIRRIRKDAFFSPDNSPHHRRKFRDFYHALQRSKIDERRKLLSQTLRRGKLLSSTRHCAALAAHALLLLRGAPTTWG
jgi:glycosyltransferase involved in cell wall biosynthesis